MGRDRQASGRFLRVFSVPTKVMSPRPDRRINFFFSYLAVNRSPDPAVPDSNGATNLRGLRRGRAYPRTAAGEDEWDGPHSTTPSPSIQASGLFPPGISSMREAREQAAESEILAGRCRETPTQTSEACSYAGKSGAGLFTEQRASLLISDNAPTRRSRVLPAIPGNRRTRYDNSPRTWGRKGSSLATGGACEVPYAALLLQTTTYEGGTQFR